MALPAGIVLQAYLPDSHRVQRELAGWAIARCARGGAPIKLRVVKGANLAMERIEAELHGWPQAPFPTKLEVDANFKRMLEYGCRPEHARAVHLGIASHNLFDVAYGLVLREDAGVEPGWSSRCSRAWPITRRAWCRRGPAGCCSTRRWCAPRISTARSPTSSAASTRTPPPDNFLRHVFGLEPGSPDWDLERDRFLGAFDLVERCRMRRAAPRIAGPRRCRRPPRGDLSASFVNEPDTDWAVAASTGSGSTASPGRVARAAGGDGAAPDRRASWRARRRAGRRTRPLASGRIRLSPRAGGPRPGEPRARRRPRRAGGLGRPRPRRSAARLLDAAPAVLARRRGDLVGAMIVDGAKTATEADPEVSEAIDFARYYARALGAGDTVDGVSAEALGVVVSRRPGTSRSRSRPAACWPRWPPATRSSSSPRSRRCWSAGSGRRALGGRHPA